ncbi:MarR family transcriptional regulator [Streptomyces seoulensis]|uniref:MarR family transcriptional regulator n=1 Tax=Streptomyces seoulensis TaxID=73044 RepID=A0A4P6U3U8_STRSO|nr:MarR family transcriptional regulator [Streptomyces seoulensis]
MAQLTLLEPLATSGEGLAVGRLAATAEVSVPTATRMLKQLEAAGAVTRQRSPHDERQVLVRLTDDGANRLAATRTELRTRQTEALSHFGARERHEPAAQLQRLAAVIGDTVPTRPGRHHAAVTPPGTRRIAPEIASPVNRVCPEGPCTGRP